MLDVKAEAKKLVDEIYCDHVTTLTPDEFVNQVDEDKTRWVNAISALAARVRNEAIAPYREAIAAHDAKVAKVPTCKRPKTAAEGLRFLAKWFDAMYPDDENTEVQDDLRRWANEWESVRADAIKDAMELACRAVCSRCGDANDQARLESTLHSSGWPPRWKHRTHYCSAHYIRAAFAKPAEAGEARDIGKEIVNDLKQMCADYVRAQFDKAAVGLNECVDRFAAGMLAKLMTPKNRAKGDREGWLSMDLPYLEDRLSVELVELRDAIRYGRPVEEIEAEAYDVANFAMMIADKARTLNIDVAKPQPERVIHGKTCPKVPHIRNGYLHGEDDDSPYWVDGAEYCGRCHMSLD